MDLSTTYLGLKLGNPFIAGASPQCDHIETAQALEEAGISALVMHSLFEEQIERASEPPLALTHPELYKSATSYFPGESAFTLNPFNYAGHLRGLKEVLKIPVIASLNGATPDGWVSYARILADAGADAIELNMYDVATRVEQTGGDVETKLLNLVERIRGEVRIPLAVKLSPFFSALPNFTKRLTDAGADGLVLFNRSYFPDIDTEELRVTPRPDLSGSWELPLRLRWLGILFGRTSASLSVTGGVHTVEDALRAILSGADTVQLVSVLLQRGPGHLKELLAGMKHWMERRKYNQISEWRGILSLKNCPDPSGYERGTYALGLQGWNNAKPAWPT